MRLPPARVLTPVPAPAARRRDRVADRESDAYFARGGGSPPRGDEAARAEQGAGVGMDDDLFGSGGEGEEYLFPASAGEDDDIFHERSNGHPAGAGGESLFDDDEAGEAAQAGNSLFEDDDMSAKAAEEEAGGGAEAAEEGGDSLFEESEVEDADSEPHQQRESHQQQQLEKEEPQPQEQPHAEPTSASGPRTRATVAREAEKAEPEAAAAAAEGVVAARRPCKWAATKAEPLQKRAQRLPESRQAAPLVPRVAQAARKQPPRAARNKAKTSEEIAFEKVQEAARVEKVRRKRDAARLGAHASVLPRGGTAPASAATITRATRRQPTTEELELSKAQEAAKAEKARRQREASRLGARAPMLPRGGTALASAATITRATRRQPTTEELELSKAQEAAKAEKARRQREASRLGARAPMLPRGGSSLVAAATAPRAPRGQTTEERELAEIAKHTFTARPAPKRVLRGARPPAPKRKAAKTVPKSPALRTRTRGEIAAAAAAAAAAPKSQPRRALASMDPNAELSTAARKRQRDEFDAGLKERQAARAIQAEAEAQAAREEEDAAYARDFEAKRPRTAPVPDFSAPFAPSLSEATLTVPYSPVVLRRSRRHAGRP